MKIGVFPGSFDPFTKGHELVVRKSLDLFDKVIIGVGINTSKTYFFDTDKRLKHIASLFENESKIEVIAYQKMTVDFCKDVGAQFIIRGLRDTKDYEYEKAIAHMNQQIAGIETVLFFTDPLFASVSSTIIREIHKNGADIEQFVTKSHLLV